MRRTNVKAGVLVRAPPPTDAAARMTLPARLAFLRDAARARLADAPGGAREGAPRALLWTARAGAFALSLAAGVLFAAHLTVSTGTLGLGPFVPALQAAIDARSDGALAFGDVSLARREGGGPVDLVLTDVGLDTEQGTVALPDLALTLDTGAMLRGDLAPRFVTARGGELTLTRTRDGVRVGQIANGGQDASEGGAGRFALAGLVDRARAGGFEGVRLTGATIRVRSDLSDQALTVTGARVDIWAQADGYAAAATAPLGEGRVALRAEVRGQRPEAELLLARVPPRALAGLFPGLPLRAAHTRMSGNARFADGAFRFDVTAAPGAIETPLGTRRLRRARLRGAYDLARRRLDVDHARVLLGTDEAVLSGHATLDGAPRFEAQLSRLHLTPPGYDAPLPATGGAVSGAWEAGALRFAADLAVPDGRLAASGALTPGAPLGAELTLRTDDPLTAQTVLALWPGGVAPGARVWTTERLLAGRTQGLDFRLSLAPDRQRGVALPPEAVRLNVAMTGVDLAFLEGFPSARGASATLALDLSRLRVEAEGGRIGDAAHRNSVVRIEGLRTPQTRLFVTSDAAGRAPDLLALADAPAFGLIERAGMTPAQFDGEGAFTLRIERALPPPGAAPVRPVVAGEGRFERLALEGLPAGIALSEGEGTVTLTPDALVIESALRVQGVPATGTLTRTLGEEPGTRIEAVATLSPADADVLGLPIRRYMTGEAPARFVLTGTDRLSRGEFEVDLTPARLDVPLLGLRKPVGARGAGRATLTLPEGEPPRLSALKLVTDDVLVEGAARFDEAGGLSRLELPRVFSEGHANLSAVLTRRAGGLHLNLEGRYADLSGLVARALTGGGGGSGGSAGGARGGMPFGVDAQLGEARLRGGAVVRRLRAEGARGPGGATLSLAGDLGSGRVSFELGPDPDGAGREVLLAADEGGMLLRALFGITSVEGGAARLRALAVRDGPLAGTIQADGVILRDAPLVARLLSVGSLDGLAGVLNGEGLRFDEVAGDFVLREGRLGLQDVRMTGSALGLSAGGEVDLSGRLFDLSGAVAPAYGVNSVLGGIPGLGELFVSRRGEGVVAFGYAVEGPIAEPTVTVNTLSALTPGVFRRIFEPVRQRQPTTAEILEAATEAARSREDRMTSTRAEDMMGEADEEAGSSQ